MNINRIIRRIKRIIGIYGIALPFDDLDKEILEILEDTTLPVFSKYCPDWQIISIDTEICQKVYRKGNCDLYLLPDFGEKEILYVKRVEYNEQFLRTSLYPTYLGTQSTTAFGDLLCSNVGKQIADSITNAITFHYEHPRKLYIYDALVSSKLLVTIGFVHDSSFQSINPTTDESFFQLAALDVKAGLYPTIKHYEGLDTVYGRIELKLDNWANAEEERNQLIEKWDESYLLDFIDLDYY